jgi:hypothetical protein
MATTKRPAAKKAAPKKAAPKKAAPKKAAPKKAAPKLRIGASAKDAATKRGEPYVSVLNVELDPDNLGNGAFELDWNDIFVARLIKAGYEGKDDAQIVDRWFQTICRNVILENYEQWEANQPKEDRLTLQRRDIGDGRTEIS